MEKFERKRNISFQGKGNILIKYKKYTPSMESEIRSHFEKIVGKINGNIRAFLLKNETINEKNELIKLPPQKVIITNGDGIFDEKDIQGADFVFQKGGRLEKVLHAKTVAISGGSHIGIKAKNVNTIGKQNSGVIYTQNFRARNAQLFSEINISGEANLYNSTNSRKIVSQIAYVRGKSELKNLEIKSLLVAQDESKISDSIITGDVKGNSNTVFENINCQNAKLEGNAAFIDSKTMGHISMSENSKIQNLKYAESVMAYGNAKVHNAKIGRGLETLGNVEIINVEVEGLKGITLRENTVAEKIKAPYLYFHHSTHLKGSIEGCIENLDKEVILDPQLKLDKKAYDSLPFSKNAFKHAIPGRLMIT